MVFLLSQPFRLELLPRQRLFDVYAPEFRGRIVPVFNDVRSAFRVKAERRPVEPVMLNYPQHVRRPWAFYSNDFILSAFGNETEIVPRTQISDLADKNRIFL